MRATLAGQTISFLSRMKVVLLLVAALASCEVVFGLRDDDVYRENVYQPYPNRSGYRHSVQCYQCAYSPAKTVYKTIKYPVEVKDNYGHYGKTKVIYRTKTVPLRKTGGWDKCLGPFDHHQAKAFGLDVSKCNNNCYIRIDNNGNVFRGCYKGEFGVNPQRIGCSRQAGQLYCFCKGERCNNGAAPAYTRH